MAVTPNNDGSDPKWGLVIGEAVVPGRASRLLHSGGCAGTPVGVIGVPFYVRGMADRFDPDVVGDFVAEYVVGRTPKPCRRCSEEIKFAAVLDRALAPGFGARRPWPKRPGLRGGILVWIGHVVAVGLRSGADVKER